MSDMAELQKRFDALSADLAPAQHKCNRTYNDWQDACHAFEKVAAERNRTWSQMMDLIANPQPPPSKAER